MPAARKRSDKTVLETLEIKAFVWEILAGAISLPQRLADFWKELDVEILS